MKISKNFSFRLTLLICSGLWLQTAIASAVELRLDNHSKQAIELAQNSPYIGLRFGGQYGTNKLPSELATVTGWAIVDEDKELSDYAIDEIYSIGAFLKNQELIILFNQRIGGTDDENAEYQVIDAVSITEPTIKDVSAAKSALKGLVCFVGDDLENLDPEIIALVNPENASFIISDIKQAWRANRNTGKIESISSDGIGCGNLGSFGF